MENEEGIERLFFDFAAESRLGILRELLGKNLRINEIARKLDLTATEAFRQVQRLYESLLIQKLPDGSYSISEYGKIAMQLLPSYEFIFKHKAYFLDHDIWRLPKQFVERIGELSATTFVKDSIASISKIEQVMRRAEKFHWGIGEGQITESMGLIATEQSNKGVKLRILSPFPPATQHNIENRTVSPTPVFLVLTENEAVVCLRFTNGQMDYGGFYGEDAAFLSWARDLFLYYWNKERT